MHSFHIIIYLIGESLYPFSVIFPFYWFLSHRLTHFYSCFLCIWLYSDTSFKQYHSVIISSVWFMAFSIMLSRYTHVVAKQDFPLSHGWIIFHCVYVCMCVCMCVFICILYLLYPFICRWAIRFFLYFLANVNNVVLNVGF